MRLERQAVARAALRLLDQHGLDGLSLRRLAAEVDVQAPALYWYFRNKQALLDELAHLARVDHAPPPRVPGQTWHAWLAQRARALRRGLLAHRDGARLHAATQPTTDQLTVADDLLDVLVAVGFSRMHATSSLLAISHYTVGSVMEQQASGAGSLSDAADSTFEHGLQLLLAGMRAQLD